MGRLRIVGGRAYSFCMGYVDDATRVERVVVDGVWNERCCGCDA